MNYRDDRAGLQPAGQAAWMLASFLLFTELASGATRTGIRDSAMDLETRSSKLSILLGPCPKCGDQREQDRGDVADGRCWRCRSRAGKMVDVFLAASEGDTTRIPEYEELIGKLRARYDDPVHPRMTDRALLEKLRSDLRVYPVDPANAPTIDDDLDAREFIHHESTANVLAFVDELTGQKRQKKSPKTTKAGRPRTATRDKKLAAKFEESSISMRAFAESQKLPASTCRSAVKRGKEALKCAKKSSDAK